MFWQYRRVNLDHQLSWGGPGNHLSGRSLWEHFKTVLSRETYLTLWGSFHSLGPRWKKTERRIVIVWMRIPHPILLGICTLGSKWKLYMRGLEGMTCWTKYDPEESSVVSLTSSVIYSWHSLFHAYILKCELSACCSRHPVVCHFLTLVGSSSSGTVAQINPSFYKLP